MVGGGEKIESTGVSAPKDVVGRGGIARDQSPPVSSIEPGEDPMPRRNFFFLISLSALLALGFTSARANRHRHSVSISDGHKHPATDCSDLRIRFDDRDAVVRSEERTLTKAEAAVLQVRPHTNGGVQVTGWDNANYSVTACEAAAASGGAGSILSQLTM